MHDDRWLTAEARDAYFDWQYRHAEGATRRLFSDQSIKQHCAMFDRFHRFLVGHGANLANFNDGHLSTFLDEVNSRRVEGSPISTGHRYIKLIDRLCRHLVETGVRKSNPAEASSQWLKWPDQDPQLLFLDEAEDARLQDYVQVPLDGTDPLALRDRAFVALLLGTGVTASEGRYAKVSEVSLDPRRPCILVPARKPRRERKVTIAAFALPALEAWFAYIGTPRSDAALFPSPEENPDKTKPIGEWTLNQLVKGALEAIEFTAEEMGPRLLRNTYARRQLLNGRTDADVSALLGLVSLQTVHRIRLTMVGESEIAA